MAKSQTQPTPPSNRARREAARRAQEQRQRQRRLLIGGGGLVGLLVIVGVAVLLITHQIQSTQQTQQQNAGSLTVDGVQCLGSESLAYHIHAHLSLYQNGKPVTLPANIGIPLSDQLPSGSCYYWLHVHDTTGVVHIESPIQQNYTLGQFLDIWQRTAQLDSGSKFSTPPVDDAFVRALRAAAPADVHVYVGDKPTTDYASIPLTAHELITIEVGGPIQPPTTTYTFPDGE